jgi:hypothetical protein
MKHIVVLVAISVLVLGCQLVSDYEHDHVKDPISSSLLYGISSFDQSLHFVSVDALSGTHIVLNKLPGISAVRGQATINPELGQYYFTTEAALVAVNIADGKIVKSFKLPYPNTGNIQYNSIGKKINGLSFIDGHFHYVEIDILTGEMKKLRPLNIKGISGSSGNIDCGKNKYYFVSERTIYVLDLATGSPIDSLYVDLNFGGLRLVKDNVLFGVDLSQSQFSNFDLTTSAVNAVNSFAGSLNDHTAVDVKKELYFYYSGYAELTCVDIASGAVKATHSLPHDTFQLAAIN